MMLEAERFPTWSPPLGRSRAKPRRARKDGATVDMTNRTTVASASTAVVQPQHSALRSWSPLAIRTHWSENERVVIYTYRLTDRSLTTPYVDGPRVGPGTQP